MAIEILGELAAIVGAVCFGLANVILKSQGGKIKPTAINAIRLSMSSIIFFVIIAALGSLKKTFTMGWSTSLLLVGGSVLGLIFGDTIFFFSQQLIGLSRAYPIAVSYPLLTYIFGMIFLDETFHWLRMLGVVTVVVGVYFVATSTSNKSSKKHNALKDNDKEQTPQEGKQSKERDVEKKEDIKEEDHDDEINWIRFQDNSKEQQKIATDQEQEEGGEGGGKREKDNKKRLILGICCAVFTAICWTAGTLLMAGALTSEIDHISANALRIICITPLAIIGFFSGNRGRNKSTFSWKGIGAILLAGILGNAIGGLLYVYALVYSAPSTTAAITAAAPVVATPLSVVFLKERLSWILVIGTLLTVGGIWLIILF